MYAVIIEFVFVDDFTFWHDDGGSHPVSTVLYCTVLCVLMCLIIASSYCLRRGVMTDGTPLGAREIENGKKSCDIIY
jgi:hypothetical protein